MATHITLQRDQAKARKAFIEILNRPDEPVVLVLWDDDTAVAANDFVQRIAESNEGSQGIYRFVNFVVAPEPDSIIDVLKQLDNNSNADLDDLENSVIVSISPFRNIVSEVITKKRFMKGKGSLNVAILSAWHDK
jgi:hypothetical protein